MTGLGLLTHNHNRLDARFQGAGTSFHQQGTKDTKNFICLPEHDFSRYLGILVVQWRIVTTKAQRHQQHWQAGVCW